MREKDRQVQIKKERLEVHDNYGKVPDYLNKYNKEREDRQI